ncbi:unnamed protein product [Cunninghamella echinulata]
MATSSHISLKSETSNLEKENSLLYPTSSPIRKYHHNNSNSSSIENEQQQQQRDSKLNYKSPLSPLNNKHTSKAYLVDHYFEADNILGTFEHPSFTRQSKTSHSNDHNIWNINSEKNSKYGGIVNDFINNNNSHQSNNNISHDNIPKGSMGTHYQQQQQHHQQQQQHDHHVNRSISPGAYFGARSLPLESMADLWQTSPKNRRKFSNLSSNRRMSMKSSNNNLSIKDNNQQQHSNSSLPPRHSSISYASSLSDPLWASFKALPATLHHHHQWNRWEIEEQKSSNDEEQEEQEEKSKASLSNISPLKSLISSISKRASSSKLSASLSVASDDIDQITGLMQSLHIQNNNSITDKSLNEKQRQRRQKKSSYSLYPKDKLTIRCIIQSGRIHTQGGYLLLTNTNEYHQNDSNNSINHHHHHLNSAITKKNQDISFHLYSAKGKIIFDEQSGSVSPGETKNLWIQPRLKYLERLIKNFKQPIMTTTNSNNNDNNSINSNNNSNSSMIEEERSQPHFDETIALLINQDMYRIDIQLDIIENINEDEDDEDDEDKEKLVEEKIIEEIEDNDVNSNNDNMKDENGIIGDPNVNNNKEQNCTTCPFCMLENYPFPFFKDNDHLYNVNSKIDE